MMLATHLTIATIQRLTPEALRAAAQSAAAQHIPLAEANHYEPGTDLWAQFNQAYGAYATALLAQPHPAQLRRHVRHPHHAPRLEKEAA